MKRIKNHIPISPKRRPGTKADMETITIHNTANPTSNALGERNWLVNPQNDRTASWHIAVDDKQVVEAIPLDEVAWHAGDRVGNATSIGVEICESGNYALAVENAAKWVAEELIKRNWGVDRLRRHFDWSGKICPRKMFDAKTKSWAKWGAFKNQVQRTMEEKRQEVDVVKLLPWQVKLAQEAIDDLTKKGKITDPQTWKKKVEDGTIIQDMPWLFFVMLNRI